MSGGVRGYVVAADGASSIANAQVTVVNGPVRALVDDVVTDVDGGFLLGEMRAGRWELMAKSPSGYDGRATVRVFDNAMSEVTIALAGEMPVAYLGGAMLGSRAMQPLPKTAARAKGASTTRRSSPQSPRSTPRPESGTVEGRVLTADERVPVADAAITVVRGAGPAPDVSPLTDSAGWFALDGLSPGEWVLRALGPQGERGEVTIQVTSGFVSATILVEPENNWQAGETD